MKKNELLEAKKSSDYARELINLKKFDEANHLLDLTLKKYPEFPSAKLQYGILKMATGYIEEGKEILNKLRETYEGELAILQFAFFESNFGSIEKAEEYFNMLIGTSQEQIALLESIYLDIRREKYEAAYEKVNRGKIKFLYPNLYTFIIMKLGITDSALWIESSDYFIKQLVNYSHEKALEHILAHGSKLESKKVHGVFAPYVDIEKLFWGASGQLNPDNIIHTTEVDRYKLYCPNLGKDKNGKKADYCSVVAIHGTPDILTMYPSSLDNGYTENFSFNGNATIGEDFKVVAVSNRLN